MREYTSWAARVAVSASTRRTRPPSPLGASCRQRVLGLELPVGGERRGAVPESLVDRRFRRGESGERFAAPRHVVELRIHHPAQDAAPAVGGVHRDHADRRHREPGAAGHGDVERVRAGRAHDGVAVADCEGAVGGEEVSRVLVVLVEDRAARTRSGRHRKNSTSSSSRIRCGSRSTARACTRGHARARRFRERPAGPFLAARGADCVCTNRAERRR